MALYRKLVDSAFGRFMIEANEAGLARVFFPEAAARLNETSGTFAHLDEAVTQLTRYFSGLSHDFTGLVYDFSEVTDFQKRILRTLLTLKGKTVSYSDLAEKSGYPRSGRAVGTAMNRNPFPILIPCHRVVLADGSLGQYAFGSAWKKRLLAHEEKL
jgi:methylated-DNA-[protein]-cysteine S-methyltransferase